MNMNYIEILFFFAILTQYSLVLSQLCPVSSIKSNYDEFYTYPIDIYSPTCSQTSISNCQIRTNTSTNSTRNPTFFTCYACERNEIGNHTCSRDISVCPIDEHNINKAIEEQKKWIDESVLCDLKATISLKNITNHFIIIGGSVTAGVATFGCENEIQCSLMTSFGANERCSWPTRFSAWATTLGPSVKVFNLAHPGYNSDTYKDELRNKLNQISYRFTPSNSDIILIDLSVNDANTFGTASKALTLKRGLESLIRNIYHMSKNHSMPAIIILEQWFQLSSQSIDYSKIYQEIAMYYNISIWSYKDVISDTHYLQHSTQDVYKDHLLWKHNIVGGAHPPWHNHLYHADLIASIILKQFQSCTSTTNNNNHNNNNIQMNLYKYPIIKSSHELPQALYQGKFHHCNDLVDPLLVISANDVYKARNNENMDLDLGTHRNDLYYNNSIPLYRANPSSSWKVYEDRIGRPGFIHEYSNTNNNLEVKLTFYLNTTQVDFFNKADVTPLLLQLSYLKTYQNAGHIKLLQCNNPIIDGRYEEVKLDALWNDFHIFKFSLPEIFSIPIGRCRNNDGTSTIELIHYSNIQNENDEIVKARGNQKFKLFQLKVCNMA